MFPWQKSLKVLNLIVLQQISGKAQGREEQTYWPTDKSKTELKEMKIQRVTRFFIFIKKLIWRSILEVYFRHTHWKFIWNINWQTDSFPGTIGG